MRSSRRPRSSRAWSSSRGTCLPTSCWGSRIHACGYAAAAAAANSRTSPHDARQLARTVRRTHRGRGNRAGAAPARAEARAVAALFPQPHDVVGAQHPGIPGHHRHRRAAGRSARSDRPTGPRPPQESVALVDVHSRDGCLQPRRVEPDRVWGARLAGDRRAGRARRGLARHRGRRGGGILWASRRCRADARGGRGPRAPPHFHLLMAVALWDGLPFVTLALAIGLTSWFGTSRLVRAEVLSLQQRDFVVAARALGAGDGRVIFRHVLPNAAAPIIVSAALGVGNVLLLEASLS